MEPISPSPDKLAPPPDDMTKPPREEQAYSLEIPPTPESVIPQPSSSPAGPTLAHTYSSSPSTIPAELATSSSPSGPSSTHIMTSTHATDIETPCGKRTISNRFWEKNGSRSSKRGPGVDLASDTSEPEPEEDPSAARARKHRALDSRIKRLLVLSTDPSHTTTSATNPTVKTYTSLLDAFAHKPRTKKKRAKATTALLSFLQDHAYIVELYNAFVPLDSALQKDRVLPTFLVEYDDDDDAASASVPTNPAASRAQERNDVQRAPAKHALADEESDEEGMVTQTMEVGGEFAQESVFNTRGLEAPSIFGRRGAVRERNERRFLLHRRDGVGVVGEGVVERERAMERDGSPTGRVKRRRVT